MRYPEAAPVCSSSLWSAVTEHAPIDNSSEARPPARLPRLFKALHNACGRAAGSNPVPSSLRTFITPAIISFSWSSISLPSCRARCLWKRISSAIVRPARFAVRLSTTSRRVTWSSTSRCFRWLLLLIELDGSGIASARPYRPWQARAVMLSRVKWSS